MDLAQKKKHAENGDLVVCVNDESAIIKKSIKQGHQIILQSLNAKHNPIIASEDFRIEGIVRNVLQYD